MREAYLTMQRSLEITTNNSCVNNCSYCPQKAFREAYKGKPRLSYEDFSTVLSKVPKDVIISFGGFSEEFLNSDCTRMVELASSEGYKIIFSTTFVGMSEDDVRRLAKCKITHLCAHLPDNLNNAKIPITEEYKNVLVLALKTLRIDSTSIMNEDFISNERVGLCEGVEKRHIRYWFNCGKLSYPQFIMLPNCDVALCCMDFGQKHILGNLLEQSFNEIASSKPYLEIQANKYKLDGDIICRSCKYAVPMYSYYLQGAWAYARKMLRLKQKQPPI